MTSKKNGGGDANRPPDVKGRREIFEGGEKVQKPAEKGAKKKTKLGKGNLCQSNSTEEKE